MSRWLVLLLVIVSACTSSTPSAAPPTNAVAPTPGTSPTLETSRIPVFAPVVSPSPAPSQSYDVNTAGCSLDDPRVGEPSLCSRFLSADLDGDGTNDQIVFYLPGHEVNRVWPPLWTVVLRTSTRVATTTTTYPSEGPLIAVADVKGDGRPVALINIGHGASTTWVGVLAFDGTRLHMNVLDPMLLVSGSVRHGDALECRQEYDRYELIHRQVSDYTADDQWDLVERVYEWKGADLSLVSVTKSVLAYRGLQPTPVGRYWGLDCGGTRSEAWAWN